MAVDENLLADLKHLNDMIQDPANYRGAFYYNPADKRIFPPKRDRAFGWTINFANRKSVAVFVVITLLMVGLLIGVAVLAS